MADATQYLFTHKDLMTTLLKERGIHEGYWQLLVNFGFAAANVGPSDSELNPTGMVQVAGIGLQRVETNKGLCVDASEVNPRPVAVKIQRKKKVAS